MKLSRRSAGAALAAVLFVVPAGLHASAAVLGDDGAVVRVTAGTYGDLFPEGAAAPSDASVLAVDVITPGEPRTRRLVPGTEGVATDLSPTLVFEPSSGTTYLIWESRSSDPAGSSLQLAGLHGDEWLGPVELSVDAAPLTGAPTVLITRDDFPKPTVTEGQVVLSRTVLHVVWSELAPGGEAMVQYTPVVIEDGAYIGWNPVYRLDEIDPNEAAAEALPSSGLTRSPTLSAGTDVHTAIIAFVNATTGRLLTVQARVLPGELGLLADRIPAAVAAAGYSDGEDRLEAIRGVLRSQIIEIGGRFNPGVIDHFADAAVAAAEVLHEAKPKRPIAALGDDLRSQIIEIGATVLGDVGRPAMAKASRVLEIQGDGGLVGEAAIPVPNLVHLRLVRDLPVPSGGDGPPKIYASEDGTRLLVSWEGAAGIVFTESLADVPTVAGEEAAVAPWSEPLVLDPGASTDAGEIDSMLRARVLQRP